MTDGPFAWLMVIVALLLIFGGGKRLPEIGRGLGGFLREFKKAQTTEPEDKDAEKAAPKVVDGSGAQEKLPPKDGPGGNPPQA